MGDHPVKFGEELKRHEPPNLRIKFIRNPWLIYSWHGEDLRGSCKIIAARNSKNSAEIVVHIHDNDSMMDEGVYGTILL